MAPPEGEAWKQITVKKPCAVHAWINILSASDLNYDIIITQNADNPVALATYMCQQTLTAGKKVLLANAFFYCQNSHVSIGQLDRRRDEQSTVLKARRKKKYIGLRAFRQARRAEDGAFTEL